MPRQPHQLSAVAFLRRGRCQKRLCVSAETLNNREADIDGMHQTITRSDDSHMERAGQGRVLINLKIDLSGTVYPGHRLYDRDSRGWGNVAGEAERDRSAKPIFWSDRDKIGRTCPSLAGL